MMSIRINTVNSALRAYSPYVKLHKGDGYFYFSFDDNVTYETESVMVYRLNDLSLDQWISAGRDFINEVDPGKI